MSKEPSGSGVANLLEQIEEELGFDDFILIGTVNSSDGVAFNLITSFGLTNQDMIGMMLEGIATVNESADEDEDARRH